MAEVKVDVTKFTVQYVLKDTEKDIPRMLPLESYSVELEVEVPDELVPYVPAYADAVRRNAEAEADDPEARFMPEYCAPPELVEGWKKKLKRDYPDSFEGGMQDDMVIDAALSCTIEDSINDSLEELWDNVLEGQLGASPEVPPGFRVAGRYVHLVEWKLK
jgi:hypothetical protein